MQACGSRFQCVAFLALLMARPVAGQGESAVSVAPPETKRTVDAFVGRWNLTGTYSEANSKEPVRLTVAMQCEPALRGVAVTCRMQSDDSGGSHVEVASIIGYSPEDKLIHLMEAPTAGAWHEHKGHWVGDVIQFERMTKLEGGKQVIEDFSIGFPSPGAMRVTSYERTPEGSSTMDIVGKKASVKVGGGNPKKGKT